MFTILTVHLANLVLQILEKVGGQLRELDISGSVRQHLSDEGLRAVSQWCLKLEVLSLSLLENITGESLLPLFQDTSRTPQLHKLLLSCRKVGGWRVFICQQ